MPVLNDIPRTWVGDVGAGGVAGSNLSDTARKKNVDKGLATIPTAAGAYSMLAFAPATGTFAGALLTFIDGLVASDSNYITVEIKNRGQVGVGTTDLLAAVAGNTTKVTGSAALVAKGRRTLITHGTLANLAVVFGDVLEIIITVTGTLPNTLTGGLCEFRFDCPG